MHIDPARSRTVVTVARSRGLARAAGAPNAGRGRRRLRSIPGIGAWTCAEVRQRSLGDPDAVSFGDYHVAKDVGWALTGTPFDDDRACGVPRTLAATARPGARAGGHGRARPSTSWTADGPTNSPTCESVATVISVTRRIR